MIVAMSEADAGIESERFDDRLPTSPRQARSAQTSGTFGDALRKLADQATYLYMDGSRYWYGTQPSVNRLAEEAKHRGD